MAGQPDLLNTFEKRAKFLQRPKMIRWLSRPVRHIIGFFWSYLCYPAFGRSLTLHSTIFTSDRLAIHLPAGLDIYLTGVKSHDSELRLVRYLLKSIKPDDTVIDAVAHPGYYSLVLVMSVDISWEPLTDLRMHIMQDLEDNIIYRKS